MTPSNKINNIDISFKQLLSLNKLTNSDESNNVSDFVYLNGITIIVWFLIILWVTYQQSVFAQ